MKVGFVPMSLPKLSKVDNQHFVSRAPEYFTRIMSQHRSTLALYRSKKAHLFLKVLRNKTPRKQKSFLSSTPRTLQVRLLPCNSTNSLTVFFFLTFLSLLFFTFIIFLYLIYNFKSEPSISTLQKPRVNMLSVGLYCVFEF